MYYLQFIPIYSASLLLEHLVPPFRCVMFCNSLLYNRLSSYYILQICMIEYIFIELASKATLIEIYFVIITHTIRCKDQLWYLDHTWLFRYRIYHSIGELFKQLASNRLKFHFAQSLNSLTNQFSLKMDYRRMEVWNTLSIRLPDISSIGVW